MAKDETVMGGAEGWFQDTKWSTIMAAGAESAEHRQDATAKIIGRYWKPVYCYLRRKGMGNEDAKDLTQGFFQEIILGRRLAAQADQGKGRFRTFLLTALTRYAANAHRNQGALKRTPAGGLVSLEGFESSASPVDTRHASPDQAFTYAWASALLAEVIEEVRVACQEDDLGVHWQVFWARVIQPVREGAAAPSLSEVRAAYSIADEKTASNMEVTVRRRFKKALRSRVRELVTCEAEVDQEIRELMEILSTGGAAS